MAAPRRPRPGPDGTYLDAEGRRWHAGGRPTNLDGTPITAAQMREELDDPPPAKPRRRAAARRRARTNGRRPSWSGRALGQNTLAPVGFSTDATGFVLALITWGWFVLPMLAGGPDAVRDVARAKFTNRGPDGKWLP